MNRTDGLNAALRSLDPADRDIDPTDGRARTDMYAILAEDPTPAPQTGAWSPVFEVHRPRPARRVALLGGLAAAVTAGLVVLPSLTGGGSDVPVAANSVWSSSVFSDGAASEIRNYVDLASMAKEADLVVKGQVESVRFSRTFGSDEPFGGVDYALMQLRVDEVLADAAGVTKLAPNDPATAAEGDVINLEFMMPRERLAEVNEALPTPPGIYFLANEGLDAERFGSPTSPEDAGYYIFVSSQGLFEEQGGKVTTPLRDEPDLSTPGGEEPDRPMFPADLRGMPFDALVEQVSDVPVADESRVANSRRR